MNKSGEWSLAPTFDVTYSFNPEGRWTSSHQITLNGKRNTFTMDDFNACARLISMKRGRATTIVREVLKTVARWPDYANIAGVPIEWRDRIYRTLCLEI